MSLPVAAGRRIASTRVRISEGEVIPVALTVEAGDRLRVSLPLGAFTLREGRAPFVATVDVVGLAAVVLGIRIGGRGLKAARPAIRALADRVRATS